MKQNMQDQDLFEYAIIRLVPRVEREEFINVGVVLYCARQKYLKAKMCIDANRICAFCPDTDIAEVEHHLNAFERICEGGKYGGPIGLLDAASRFRWLTAARSTILQTSKVHPGFCGDAGEKLQHLYSQMVDTPRK